jgi:hypothetical protein
VYNAGSQTVTDSLWHRFDYVRVSSTERYLYLDGALMVSSTTDAGSISDSGNLPLSIGGFAVNGGASAQNCTLALVRLSATAPSATQVLQMYDAEKGMFVASAECLLQSGTTDAVIDVDVDPLSGKVIVTQTDAITIFDGLVVDSKPTVNSGASEKGKLWGDLRAEQNAANAYVTAPATDQRQVNEMVRGLASDLPAGVDLSKAKAWAVLDGTGTINLLASYNIKSITDEGTGNYTFTFSIPFKAGDDSVADKPTYTISLTGQIAQPYVQQQRTTHCLVRELDTNNSTADDAQLSIVCFGELENE